MMVNNLWMEDQKITVINNLNKHPLIFMITIFNNNNHNNHNYNNHNNNYLLFHKLHKKLIYWI